VGWFSINYAQGHLPATIVAPTMLGQPLTTAVLSVLLLGETFTVWKIVGGLAVLTGVYLTHRSQNGHSE
jgi:drug/metabolite transporter (DMT)-like permease